LFCREIRLFPHLAPLCAIALVGTISVVNGDATITGDVDTKKVVIIHDHVKMAI
jgi:hypothetical protein